MCGADFLREVSGCDPPGRRHALRGNFDLSSVPEQEMHHHANPLLAWGRQSRDFVRQLDAFDDAERARLDFDMLLKIDFFDDDSGPQPTLLRQVQDNIRDLVPVEEAAGPAHRTRAGRPCSICFQIAHSTVRELEILHDHLLGLLADRSAATPGQEPLQPRDIVVMVPDIEQMAPRYVPSSANTAAMIRGYPLIYPTSAPNHHAAHRGTRPQQYRRQQRCRTANWSICLRCSAIARCRLQASRHSGQGSRLVPA